MPTVQEKMTKQKKWIGAVAALLILAGTTQPARAAGSTTDLNILIIGSSLVRGIKPSLTNLFKSVGIRAKVKGHGPARWTLENHASSKRTKKLIAARPWDIVLLADSSVGFTANHYDDAAMLHDIITQTTGAEVCFMMTWYDEDAPLSLYESLKGVPGGNIGYVPIALDLDIPIAPAGWAMRNAAEDGLPLRLWRRAQHLSGRGKYLVGATIYATLTQASPSGLWAPGSLSPADAQYVQDLAYSTVMEDADDWNLPLNN